MPARRITHTFEQAELDGLLDWLDSDRERAGERYEQIRWRLITIFAARNCAVPEELADETIDRVARRVADIAASYTGDKALYFFGVANNVHHEYLKKPAPPESAGAIDEGDDDRERRHSCLEQCLEKLPADAREMIVRYYSQQKQAKIELHKAMAAEMGVTINTLRLRVLRLKEKLQPCVRRCLERTDVF
jgi:DNA-directed RNA polymerase specialized sigma24 family protein